MVDLPPSRFKKTIVFDMDETLIHCVEDFERDSPDVVLDIQFTGESEITKAGINIRPGVREILEYANTLFRVVVFTASEKDYANPILNYLDPKGTLIKARYFRDSCV